MNSTPSPCRRIAVAVAAAIASELVSLDARASDPTKDDCVTANEDAQSLVADGKLGDARARLRICISNACPAVVRDDCAERLDEVERTTPTIIFTLREGAEEVRGWTVTVDGAPTALAGDSGALSVDPGEHTFTFAVTGRALVTRQLVLRRAVKERHEIVLLEPSSEPTRSPQAPTASPPSPGFELLPASDGMGAQKIAALAAAGSGGIALVLGGIFALSAKAAYGNSDTHCAGNRCDAAGVSIRDAARTKGDIATGLILGGTAALATAGVLWLTSPTRPSSHAPRVGVASSNLFVGGVW